MQKTLKYTTALGSAMVALAFAVTAASADTGVVNTGDNATINSGSTQNTTVTVSNSNSASISQSSFSIANTGGNFTDGNIGGGGIDSGNAVTSTSLEAQANQNQTGIALAGSAGSSGDVDIVNTGDDLDVDAGDTTNTTAVVTNTNQLNSEQESWSIANSGLNGAFDNVEGGDINTGTAGTSTSFEVEANANETMLDLSGLGDDDDNALSFVNTGDDADVDFGDETNTTVVVSSFNEADVEQSSFSLANSGLNFTDGNVEGGDIDSGNAAAVTDFEVMANQNQTGVDFDGLLGAMGDDDVEITNTGDNLMVNSGTTVNTTATATSSNASATAQTSVEASNSGLNFSSSNVEGGDTDSGNAGTMTGFMSGVNWNQTIFD